MGGDGESSGLLGRHIGKKGFVWWELDCFRRWKARRVGLAGKASGRQALGVEDVGDQQERREASEMLAGEASEALMGGMYRLNRVGAPPPRNTAPSVGGSVNCVVGEGVERLGGKGRQAAASWCASTCRLTNLD